MDVFDLSTSKWFDPSSWQIIIIIIIVINILVMMTMMMMSIIFFKRHFVWCVDTQRYIWFALHFNINS